MRTFGLIAFCLFLAAAKLISAAEPLSVPAFTAYSDPDPHALKISEREGVAGWTDAKNKVIWYGELKAKGKLDVSIALHLAEKASCKLRLTVAEKTSDVEMRAEGAQPLTANFGSFEIQTPGYYSFTLEGISKEGKTFGELHALLLSGPAAEGAHFNLKPRRNAASVHLGYPTPKDAKIEWFYNEVTVRAEPLSSYYMACGFKRGYFGIQVNSPTERRIIFSVWDSGNEAVSRSKVESEDRVTLLAKGENVIASDFGNEGTGGHSHLVYPWKINETYRFLLAAKPDGMHTTYSGYFYSPEKKQWMLIASFRAPKDGSYLRGLYSFNEDFDGANGNKRRLAEFGNQWIKSAEGTWSELTTARFTHDPTGKEDRKDYAAGVVDGRFFLSNGGYVAEPIKMGDEIKRPAGKQPVDIELPVAN